MMPDFRCFPKGVPLSEWISVKEAAEYTGYTEGHVRYLLREGTLDGRRFGRDWFTTVKALQKYLATNPKPGPKPEDDPI
jgi:excisionase family DNA binding protein